MALETCPDWRAPCLHPQWSSPLPVAVQQKGGLPVKVTLSWALPPHPMPSASSALPAFPVSVHAFLSCLSCGFRPLRTTCDLVVARPSGQHCLPSPAPCCPSLGSETARSLFCAPLTSPGSPSFSPPSASPSCRPHSAALGWPPRLSPCPPPIPTAPLQPQSPLQPHLPPARCPPDPPVFLPGGPAALRLPWPKRTSSFIPHLAPCLVPGPSSSWPPGFPALETPRFLPPHPTITRSHCCCSDAQSCPALFNPMDRFTPGLPVLHYFLEFAQTQVHQVSDAIQPSRPLSPPSPLALSLSQHRGLFQ